MGLREKAFLSLAAGLREKANYFYGKTSHYLPSVFEKETGDGKNDDMALENQVFKKEHQLQTVMEISKEIYQSLNPNELMNMFLLTFMGQTRSSKGAFLLKDKNQWKIEVNKGVCEEELKKVFSYNWNSIQDLRSSNDFSQLDLVCPVLGKKQNILGYIVLEKTGLQNLQDEESVLLPLLSLGGIALENALLYDNMQTRFNQLEALAQIGDTLQQSPDLHEVLFLAFSTLEHGLGIKKLLVLLKNKKEEFQVFDAYGCREETHRLMNLDVNFPFYDLIMSQHQIIDCPSELSEYLAEEDREESNIGLILPLRVYENTNGVLVFLQNEEESHVDLNWHKKLYELVASYFASAIYLLQNKPQNQESSLSLKQTLNQTIQEQLDFAIDMDLNLQLSLVSSKNKPALFRWSKTNHIQIIELVFDHFLLLSPQAVSQESFTEAQNRGTLTFINQSVIHQVDEIKNCLQTLGL